MTIFTFPPAIQSQQPAPDGGAGTVRDTVADWFGWQVFSHGGTPITALRLIAGLAALVLGLYAARWIARLFARHMIDRRGVDSSASVFLQSVSFCLLAVPVSLVSLSAANLPLSALANVLQYKILNLGGVPLTVKEVIFALLVLAMGLYAARRFAQILAEAVFIPLKLELSVAAALQSITYYLFIILVFLLFLELLNVPLTAFAVFGGAIAIGVGFGSQNIINNFISGLILLGERPVRVGDTIEIEGLFGIVKHVGARCTNVRTFSNIDVMVPNSYFLENRVVNWTLKDQDIRTEMPVGVAYGSPTREVEKLLLRAAEENPDVLESPAPEVLFMDFGDSALNFELRFWVDMSRSMRLRVASEIRHRIGELLREAGITIPFPQRDVHLDAAGPLQVEIRKFSEQTEPMPPE